MEKNEIETLVYSVGIIFFLVALFVISGYLIYKGKKRENQFKLMKLNEQLLQSQLEIQEQTLKTISQEIHDNIGQALTLAKLNLNILPKTGTGADDKIIATKEIVSNAIADLRSLSRSLNSDFFASRTLQEAIQFEIDNINRTGIAKATLTISGEAFETDKQKEFILFRMVQEVLNNAVKHSAASAIDVSINYSPTNLLVTINDNGKGFDASTASPNSLGLLNLCNRASLIQAKLSIQSQPGSGTKVEINLEK